MAKIEKKVHLEKNHCKGCWLCVEFCPAGCLHVSTEVNPAGYQTITMVDETSCKGCGFCELMCPEAAIRMISEHSEKKSDIRYEPGTKTL